MITTLLVCAGALLIAITGSAMVAPLKRRPDRDDDSPFYRCNPLTKEGQPHGTPRHQAGLR